MIGGGCSTATELVARNTSIPVVSKENMQHFPTKSVIFSHLQISYASTSVTLNDRSVYSKFFRTVPSDELLPSALAAIMKHFEWRQIAIFTEEVETHPLIEVNNL